MLSRNIIAAPAVSPFNQLLGEKSFCCSLNLRQHYGPVSEVCLLEDTSAVLEDSFSEAVSGVDSRMSDCSIRWSMALSDLSSLGP
jgi:hypothetical protein